MAGSNNKRSTVESVKKKESTCLLFRIVQGRNNHRLSAQVTLTADFFRRSFLLFAPPPTTVCAPLACTSQSFVSRPKQHDVSVLSHLLRRVYRRGRGHSILRRVLPASSSSASSSADQEQYHQNSVRRAGGVDRHLPLVGSCGHTLCSTCVQKQWMVRVEQTRNPKALALCPFCAKKSFRVDSKRNFFVMELVREEAEEAARNAAAAPPSNHPDAAMGPRERSLEQANARLRRRLESLSLERATWQLEQRESGRLDSKPAAARNNDSDEDAGGRRLTRSQIRSSEDESRDRVDAKPQYHEKKPPTASVIKPQSRKKSPPPASVSVE